MMSEAIAGRTSDAPPRTPTHEASGGAAGVPRKGTLLAGQDSVSHGRRHLARRRSDHCQLRLASRRLARASRCRRDIVAAKGVRWAAHPRYGLQLTQQALPEQYAGFFASLSAERVLAERAAFIGRQGGSRARGALAPLLAREISPALEKLYKRIAETDAIREMFPSRSDVERAKAAQIKHWAAISSGGLSVEYLGGVRKSANFTPKLG